MRFTMRAASGWKSALPTPQRMSAAKISRPWFVPLGPVLCGLAVTAMGFLTNYYAIFAAAILCGDVYKRQGDGCKAPEGRTFHEILTEKDRMGASGCRPDLTPLAGEGMHAFCRSGQRRRRRGSHHREEPR